MPLRHGLVGRGGRVSVRRPLTPPREEPVVYPVSRFALTMLEARRAPPLGPDGTGVVRFTARPWDMDMFFEMNNGRHLTLFDLGRFDFGMRVGLIGVLRAQRWGLVVGGASVQYRRRLRMWNRVEMATRCLGRDAKWFYFEQAMWRRGTACSAALVRTAVVAGSRGTVPTQEVADALGWPDWEGALPPWATAWDGADAKRPWPPETVLPGAG